MMRCLSELDNINDVDTNSVNNNYNVESNTVLIPFVNELWTLYNKS